MYKECVLVCICACMYMIQSIFGQCADSSCHAHGGACIEQQSAGITKIILGAESVYVHLRTFCVISGFYGESDIAESWWRLYPEVI